MIDHSLLKPFLTDIEIEQGCLLADQYQVATVCVRPSDVVLAKKILYNSKVLVTTVIGFPHGTNTTEVKVVEAVEAIDNGAVEIDMVINIGKLKSGDYEYVKQDISAVTLAAHDRKAKVKVIFENCFLSDEEKITCCKICNEVGVDFVKTSTGYGTSGATIQDVQLMRKHILPEIQVKAAGGIRTLEQFLEFKDLGCTRIGCTATADILDKIKKES